MMMTNGNIERIAACQSARGVSHSKKNIPCQDASGVYLSENGDFRIAAVADGHGDPSCMRSEKGSSFAIMTAIDCLKEFGSYYPEYCDILAFYPDRYGIQQAVRQLTDSIVCLWAERVLEDLRKNPLSDEEKDNAGDLVSLYDNGEHLERIYGTTLIAALETKDYVLMLQQGDGRCDLLFEDGTMVQPIPEDERCYANVTTSLSDEDVYIRIRSRLIEGKNRDLIACFVGTDGLDNRFYDDEELYEFYLRMSLELAKCNDANDASAYLEKELTNISIDGNGDDVSVAGLIKLDHANQHLKTALETIESKQIDKTKEWYKKNISSMKDRMNVLREMINSTDSSEQKNYLDEYLALRSRYQTIKEQYKLL